MVAIQENTLMPVGTAMTMVAKLKVGLCDRHPCLTHTCGAPKR